MKARSQPLSGAETARLMIVDAASGRIEHESVAQLPFAFEARDLLVLNDAATLPAALRVVGRPLEVRLAAWGEHEGQLSAVLFGAGDYHTPTELRPAPEALSAGDVLRFSEGLSATVVAVDTEHPRLLTLQFEQRGAMFLRALYEVGKPIQYSYVPLPLATWDVQNRFSARPWAFELPSAGQALTGELLSRLQTVGAGLTTLTHAAGISSTGDPSLDRRLPLAERYELTEAAATAVEHTRRRSGRVVAVGTSVVRALESSVFPTPDGALRVEHGRRVTELRLNGDHRLRTTDALLTGLHEIGTSHFELLEAFAPRQVLIEALAKAEERGYRQHEFGDFCLVWAMCRDRSETLS